MKNYKSLLLLFFVTLGCSVQSDCSYIKKLDFENKSFDGWNTKHLGYSYSASIEDSIVRRGKYAVRFELHEGDSLGGKEKAELKDKYNASFGETIWYSFSDFIPSNFPEINGRTILAQWHGEADDGEEARSPVLVHRYDGNSIRIELRHSSEKIQKGNDGKKIVLAEIPQFNKGVWHDWVYSAKWTYKDNGFVKAWLDGKLVVDYKGPTSYNDDKGPYFKFGVYHHFGDLPYIVFHDEYRRGCTRDDISFVGNDSENKNN